MSGYNETLNLPSTDFSMRASLAQKEPLQLERWKKMNPQERARQSSYRMHQVSSSAFAGLFKKDILLALVVILFWLQCVGAGFQQAEYLAFCLCNEGAELC